MAMMAHIILTIRLIKLWKHPWRIIEAGDQAPATIIEALPTATSEQAQERKQAKPHDDQTRNSV